MPPKSAPKRRTRAPASHAETTAELLREMNERMLTMARAQETLGAALADKDAQLARILAERDNLLRLKLLYERKFAQLREDGRI